MSFNIYNGCMNIDLAMLSMFLWL